MAKFDDSVDVIEFEGSQLYRANTPGRCWHCREETRWVDSAFLAYLCSEECEIAKWNEYQKAILGVVDIVEIALRRE